MTPQEFAEQTTQSIIDRETTASLFGYHFIQSFIQNPYKFYLRDVLGITPTGKSGSLVRGSGLHAVHEVYFKWLKHQQDAHITNPEPMPLDSLRDTAAYFFLAHKDQILSSEYDEMLTSLYKMIAIWYDKWALHDLRTFDVLAVEDPFEMKLLNGFPMTGRIDLILRYKESRKILLRDTKSTGFSVDIAYEGMDIEDQARVYMLASTKMGFPSVGLQPDIVYQRQSNTQAQRPGIIPYIESEIQSVEINLIGAFGRLYHSLKLLEKGYLPEMAFPRNGANITQFSNKDSYKLIWRDSITPGRPVGKDFEVSYDQAQAKMNLFKLTWESTTDWEDFLPHGASK